MLANDLVHYFSISDSYYLSSCVLETLATEVEITLLTPMKSLRLTFIRAAQPGLIL